MKKDGYKVNEVTCDNGVTANWLEDTWSLEITGNPEHVNRIKCSVDFEVTLSNYIVAKSEYDESVIKQEHEDTIQTEDKAKIDYRFVGANPNNYVCLKADGTCDENELYRIIGVIPTQKDDEGPYENRVKLVTHLPIAQTQWNNSSNNKWEESTLNLNILNGTYWDEIESYHQYIEEAKWYLGGLSNEPHLVSEFYENERGQSSQGTIFTVTNVGIIYPSDYGYATSGGDITSRDSCLEEITVYRGENHWSTYKDCSQNDWLNHKVANYTITSMLNLDQAFTTTLTGISSDIVNPTTYGHSLHPSFYLKSSVKYLSGTGEKNNPYLVTID